VVASPTPPANKENSALTTEASAIQSNRALLQGAFADLPTRELAFKAMFGGACAYVNGRVFASLSNAGLALKIDGETARTWLDKGGAWLQYEPDAPISKSYVLVPSDVTRDESALSAWVEKSLTHVLALPAPKPRAKKRR